MCKNDQKKGSSLLNCWLLISIQISKKVIRFWESHLEDDKPAPNMGYLLYVWILVSSYISKNGIPFKIL